MNHSGISIEAINHLKTKYINKTSGSKAITTFLDSKPLNQPFRDPELELLLKCHPSQIKVREIEYLYVKLRPPYLRRALYIKNKDSNDEDDVSYKSCLDALYGFYDKSKNNVHRISTAFRDTISNTKKRLFYLENHDKPCVLCGKWDGIVIHTDHYPIPFQEILDSFLIQYPEYQFSTIRVYEDKLTNCYNFEDNTLREKWVKHHDEMAEFRRLCQSCNSSGGAYGFKKNKALYKP